MRTLALSTLLLALLAFTPAVPAGYGRGDTVGANFGFGDAGLWDLWYFDTAGGSNIGFSLQWADARSDLDLYLYPPGSLNDGALDETPIAVKETRAWGPAQETFFVPSLPAGRYVVAVVAHQSIAAPYELYANPGTLTGTYPGAPGLRLFCPPFPYCGLP